MKTPITYYGGKQRLLKYIVPLIPEHKLYAEPFTGGAAVFFAKEPAEIEVLNDTNKALIAFIIGKLSSDTVAVLMGKYAAENTQQLLRGMVNWKSIVGLILGLLLIFALLFIDWRSLFQHKKFELKFKIWK